MKWYPSECAGGDIIRVKVGSIYHYGIFVSEGEVVQFGPRPDQFLKGGLIADQSGIKVLATDISTFSGGDIIEVGVPEKAERKRMFKPARIVETARSHMGEGGYDIIHNNCEHFVNLCAFGERRCDTVDKIIQGFANRPVCKVYFAKVGDMGDDLLYPPERQRELERVTDQRVRQEKYAVWKLLELAARHAFGVEISSLKFKKSAHGKWSTKNFYFSLSHSKGMACVAVSNSPVGVDIEEREGFLQRFSNDKGEALFKKIATPSERESSSEVTAEKLLILWIEKESAFKLYGKGRFVPDRIECGKCGAAFFETEGYAVCVCGENAARTEYFTADEGQNIHRIN